MMLAKDCDLLLAPPGEAVALLGDADLHVARRVLGEHPDEDRKAQERAKRLQPIASWVRRLVGEDGEHMLALAAVLVTEALEDRPLRPPRLGGDLVFEPR